MRHTRKLSSADIADVTDLTGFYLCVCAPTHGRPAVKWMAEYCDSDRGIDWTTMRCGPPGDGGRC